MLSIEKLDTYIPAPDPALGHLNPKKSESNWELNPRPTLTTEPLDICGRHPEWSGVLRPCGTHLSYFTLLMVGPKLCILSSDRAKFGPPYYSYLAAHLNYHHGKFRQSCYSRAWS